MKKYFITLLSGVFISIAILATFNWFVNPYNIFSSPAIKGFNALKVAAGRRGRLSKVYEVNRLQPDIIILGSSRELGIPVEPLQTDSETAYNLALANGSGYEMYRMFQHANAVHRLKTVIIGIGEGFGGGVYENFVEERLKVDSENQPTDSWRNVAYKDIFSSLFSMDALHSSINTVRKQPELDLDEFLINDRRRRISRAGGHHQMFVDLEHEYVRVSRSNSLNECKYENPEPAAIQTSKSPYFEKMMQLAYQQGIQFYIFFSPLHARLYEVHCLTGAMPGIENSKRAIIEIVESIAELHGEKPFPVWDFTGYNKITTESLPDSGDTTTIMDWYWEGSHYSAATANLILETMLGRDSEATAGFGVRVSSSNIEQQLRTIHEQRLQYHATNIADVNEVRDLVSIEP